MVRALCIALGASSTLAPLAAAQLGQSPEVQGPLQEYRIGPGDILKVTVFGHDDLTQTVIVQPDGTFAFPLLGRVKVADATPGALEASIRALLLDGFLREAQVSVSVQEYRSRTVFVVGEVARPGSYPIAAGMNVVEAIAKAGPTTANAAVEVLVVRPRVASSRPTLPAEVLKVDAKSSEKGSGEVFRINLRAVQTGDLRQNLELQANDTVFVPRAPNVYVSGQVRNPGAYPFEPGMTVRQLVSVAGGVTENGSESRLRVVREVDGKTKEVKIGLDEILHPADTVVVRRKLF